MRQPRSSEQSRYRPNERAKEMVRENDADKLARMAVEGSSFWTWLVDAQYHGEFGA